MDVIAVANQKGGAGKTTTAVHLAHGLARADRRVLAVDLDPQGSATRWLGWDTHEDGLSKALARGRGLGQLAVDTATEGLSLVPGDPYLAGAAQQGFGSPGPPAAALARALEDLEGYELVLIDSPPTLGLLAVAALAAADQLIVPVRAGPMELEHLADLEDTVQTVRGDLQRPVTLLAVVLVQARPTRLTDDVYERLGDRYGEVVCEATIRQSVRVAEAYAHGLPVWEHAPSHPVAADYQQLTDEIDRRIAT